MQVEKFASRGVPDPFRSNDQKISYGKSSFLGDGPGQYRIENAGSRRRIGS